MTTQKEKLDIGLLLFKSRSYTPIPLLILMVLGANPTCCSILGGLWIILAGEAMRTWGVSYAGRTTRSRRIVADFLVTSGPFAYVRNPLYIGNLFIILGFSLSANAYLPWIPLAIVLLFAFQYNHIVSREEQYLAETFGEEYRQYMDNVPRFIPSFSAYTGANTVTPDLKVAISSERSTLQLIALMLVLIIGKAAFFN